MSENKKNSATEALAPAGYERLMEPGESRKLQLVVGSPIELILGKNHRVILKSGSSGSFAISIDDIYFSQPASGGGSIKTDELRVPAGGEVEFHGDSGLTEIELIKSKFSADQYYVQLPGAAINFRDEKIDFADLGNVPGAYLSIAFGQPSPIAPNVSQVEITNGYGNFGVAVPVEGPGSGVAKQDLTAAIGRWRLLAASETVENQNQLADELMAMAGDPDIAEVYNNFMSQEGSTKEAAMIVAVTAFLYKDQLNAMGKEKFLAMVKGIRMAIEIGS
jgi:hypothetical protein